MTTPYEWLQALKRSTGFRTADLLAMASQNDPFNAGTPADLRDGEWFAALWERFGWKPPIHLRRIHYDLQARGDVELPDGATYINDDASWETLMAGGRAARHLDLVPAHYFVDKRNLERYMLVTDPDPDAISDGIDVPAMSDINSAVYVSLNGESLDWPSPSVEGYKYDASEQPFHLEVWVEKSGANDVLLPLCHHYGANLIVGAGYQSITAAVDLLQRVKRPTRVLYVSDFDPAGESMPAAVAREIEFYRQRYAPDLDVALDWIVLTEEQVEQYDLPRVPIKAGDTRQESWEKRRGTGRVELDALEALHPGVLGRIVSDRLDIYYDAGLTNRIAATRREARDAIHDAWDELTADEHEAWERITGEIEDVIEQYEDQITADLDPLIDQLNDALELVRGKAAEVDTAELLPDRPEAEVDDDAITEMETDYLFDSRREYLEQIGRYKAHRNEPWLEQRKCAADGCDETFPCGVGDGRRKYCSKRCSRRVAGRRYQARKRRRKQEARR